MCIAFRFPSLSLADDVSISFSNLIHCNHMSSVILIKHRLSSIFHSVLMFINRNCLLSLSISLPSIYSISPMNSNSASQTHTLMINELKLFGFTIHFNRKNRIHVVQAICLLHFAIAKFTSTLSALLDIALCRSVLFCAWASWIRYGNRITSI